MCVKNTKFEYNRQGREAVDNVEYGLIYVLIRRLNKKSLAFYEPEFIWAPQLYHTLRHRNLVHSHTEFLSHPI
jgi:hypothetical protein